ncbi:MAG: lipopolysaccharide transport periplasmic protein LptA [Deltaproteobacteria bacterium]|nr:MAG: lipopolysaccharide transport periplasmic protein LptA [Deltaproteobacteria bacterium]
MRHMKFKTFFLYLTVLAALLGPTVAFAQTAEQGSENVPSEPITIKSKTLEMNNELKMVTFSGDVNAKKDDFIINCDKMFVYYDNLPDKLRGQEGRTRINKIVALGHVIINRANGGQATAEKAVYHQKDERMVLTGNPTVKRGEDLVKGDRIIIFFKEERSVVEGSEKQKVSVTISPRHEKR